MKDLDKNISKCLEINIQSLIDAGYYKSKEDIPNNDIEELKKCIKHAECSNYDNLNK